MEFLRRSTYQPRMAEIAAAEAPLAAEPFVPENLDITVFYGGHSTRSDFDALAPYLADADIFVPEMTAWSVEKIALFSRIAQGDRNARKELERDHAGGKFNPFTAAETKGLLGSGISITPIDYSEDHDRADEILGHFDNWQILDKIVPNFRKTLDNIVGYVRTEAGLEEHRERIMARAIGPRLETLIANDPELAQKDRVRVLIQQGAAHTYFYHKLARLAAPTNTTVQRIFDRPKPIVFEHFDQLARAFRADVQVTPTQRRELAMRILARTALRFDAIPHVILESDYQRGRLVMPPAEEMVNRFSPDAIQKFHRDVVQANKRR